MSITDTLAVIWLIVVGAVLLYVAIRYINRYFWIGVAIGVGFLVIPHITFIAIVMLLYA